MSYDTATGDLLQRTISGAEATQPGGTFSLATGFTYNAAGQPLTVDPPGFASGDVTSFAYDAARGDLVLFSRTDPLVGSTAFVHDAFNRRIEVTDVNAVTTMTEYDDLDRVTRVVQEGATPADDLVTESVHTPFGDLLRTILPLGNVIEYGYDAAGRLLSIERKPDVSTSGERTLYTLDDAGNRTREERQRWNGAAWVTEATTDFVYTSRCQLDRVVQAPGAPEESVTEYAYDCNGNLERLVGRQPSLGRPDEPAVHELRVRRSRPAYLGDPAVGGSRRRQRGDPLRVRRAGSPHRGDRRGGGT